MTAWGTVPFVQRSAFRYGYACAYIGRYRVMLQSASVEPRARQRCSSDRTRIQPRHVLPRLDVL